MKSNKIIDPPSGTSLLVRKLKFHTSPNYLRDIFSRFGKIKDLYVPVDFVTRRPRGFGFVEYYNERDAHIAMREMDNADIDGSRIEVTIAQHGRSTAHSMRSKLREPIRNDRGRMRSRSYDRERYNCRYRRDFSNERDRYTGAANDRYERERYTNGSKVLVKSRYDDGRQVRDYSPCRYESKYPRDRYDTDKYGKSYRNSSRDMHDKHSRDKYEKGLRYGDRYDYKLNGHNRRRSSSYDRRKGVRKATDEETDRHKRMTGFVNEQKKVLHNDDVQLDSRSKRDQERTEKNYRGRSTNGRGGRSPRERSCSLHGNTFSEAHDENGRKGENHSNGQSDDVRSAEEKHNRMNGVEEPSLGKFNEGDEEGCNLEEEKQQHGEERNNNGHGTPDIMAEDDECDDRIRIDDSDCDYFRYRRGKSVSVSL